VSPVIHQRSGTPKRVKLLSGTAEVEAEVARDSGGRSQANEENTIPLVHDKTAAVLKNKKVLQQQLEEKMEKLRKLKMAKMYRVKVSGVALIVLHHPSLVPLHM